MMDLTHMLPNVNVDKLLRDLEAMLARERCPDTDTLLANYLDFELPAFVRRHPDILAAPADEASARIWGHFEKAVLRRARDSARYFHPLPQNPAAPAETEHGVTPASMAARWAAEIKSGVAPDALNWALRRKDPEPLLALLILLDWAQRRVPAERRPEDPLPEAPVGPLEALECWMRAYPGCRIELPAALKPGSAVEVDPALAARVVRRLTETLHEMRRGR
jgi:hypothetical protein